MTLEPEQLLAEIEDAIRSMPPRGTIRQNSNENLVWLGRVSAVIEQWNFAKIMILSSAITQLGSHLPQSVENGYRAIVILLHQAQNDLRLRTIGPTSIAVGEGMVFAYFDELRKVIELAKQDILFVDPYLDAEFVSKYLVHIANGVPIRLLTEKKLSLLLPAVEAFSKQSKSVITVRSSKSIHDRFVFVDGTSCYQSGASFKDGAKTAGTVITQIIDAFPAINQAYESLWQAAKLER